MVWGFLSKFAQKPNLATRSLLRTHPRADRPGTVVLPQEELVFGIHYFGFVALT
jgi:hypothetical protein